MTAHTHLLGTDWHWFYQCVMMPIKELTLDDWIRNINKAILCEENIMFFWYLFGRLGIGQVRTGLLFMQLGQKRVWQSVNYYKNLHNLKR